MLEVPVECDGERHLVVFAIDSLDRVRARTVDHDESTEAVLVALGGRPTGCARVCRAERALRRSVASATERVRWAGVGVTGTDELNAWRDVGIKSARVAWRWVTLGIDLPGHVSDWKAAGFRTPQAARPWIKTGFGPDQAAEWLALGTVMHALYWVQAGLGPSDAKDWSAVGVRHPLETDQWGQVGVYTAREASTWARAAVSTPQDVRTWRAARALDAYDAAAWWESGVGPDGISTWLDAGVTCGRELAVWRKLGVDGIGDLAAWHEAGVPDGLTARRWLNSGVTTVEEVKAWAAVGAFDPSEARPLTSSDAPRRPENSDGGGFFACPPTPTWRSTVQIVEPPANAAPSALTTERYHYAYGRPSTPDQATDVLEIDVDAGGWEVARRSRPVPNGRPRIDLAGSGNIPGTAEEGADTGSVVATGGAGTVRSRTHA